MQFRSFRCFAVIPLAVALMVTGATQASLAKKHHARAGHGKDIVQTTMSAGSFKTLTQALQKAGLVRTLKGRGPFTVFAPDDAAFGHLPKGSLDALLNDKKKLAKVLSYHVVPKKLMASDLTNMRSAKTLEGESLMLNAKDGKNIVDGAIVTKPDITCSNGVIQVIDQVLMPERGK